MDKATYGAEKKPETNVPELHTVEDVYEWIDKNIEYGWLGQDGKAHICEMKDFRRQYRTMSVSQTIQQKIGTCIEPVSYTHLDVYKRQIHSSQGKHRWCYPGYLCTVTVADAGNHCQSSWQRKWNRYWEQDLKRYVTVKLV